MKKVLCFVLMLCLALALCACGSSDADVVGTWTGKVDSSAYLASTYEALLPGCSDYISDVFIETTFTFSSDGTFTYEQNGDAAEARLTECLADYIVDAYSSELGQEVTREELAAAGVDVEQMAAEYTYGLAAGLSSNVVSGKYTVDGQKVTMGGVTGEVSGNSMKISSPTQGEWTVTKK